LTAKGKTMEIKGQIEIEGYYTDAADCFNPLLDSAAKQSAAAYEHLQNIICDLRQTWLAFDGGDTDGYGRGKIEVKTLDEILQYVTLLSKKRLSITLNFYGKQDNFSVSIMAGSKAIQGKILVDRRAIEGNLIEAAQKSIRLLEAATKGKG
jgi:hypothetical protein